MSSGIAAFVTFWNADLSAKAVSYQNYWPGQTVDGHAFYPFTSDAIVANTSGGQDAIRLDFAASNESVALVEQSITLGRLVQIDFYSFSVAGSGAPPAAKVLISTFIGELIQAELVEPIISINVGSSLSAVEAQAPPRKFTTTLIGLPPKT